MENVCDMKFTYGSKLCFLEGKIKGLQKGYEPCDVATMENLKDLKKDLTKCFDQKPDISDLFCENTSGCVNVCGNALKNVEEIKMDLDGKIHFKGDG